MTIEELRKIMHMVTTDVEARFERGPPGFQALPNGRPEFLPAFFDGMLGFDSGSFPEKLQQYIVAFSAIPVATFVPKTTGKDARKFYAKYVHDPDMPPRYKHDGFYLNYESIDFDSAFNYRQMPPAYNALVNAKRLNQLKVPATFTSLQLYAFFIARATVESAVIASATRMLERTLDVVDGLENGRRTEQDVEQALFRTIGLPISSVTARDLNDSWAIDQRAGIYKNEDDKKVATVFFDTLQNSGIDDEYYLRFAVYNGLKASGIDLKTPGGVPVIMGKILGSFYNEVMSDFRKGIKPAKLLKLKPVSPYNIVSVDTIAADVRQIIEGETLGTGERDASSLNHSALYRHPSFRSSKRNDLKSTQREP